jgi:hypothetical protein
MIETIINSTYVLATNGADWIINLITGYLGSGA